MPSSVTVLGGFSPKICKFLVHNFQSGVYGVSNYFFRLRVAAEGYPFPCEKSPQLGRELSSEYNH